MRRSKPKRRSAPSAAGRTPQPRTGCWGLVDAKTHFGEVVRKASDEGPQHITVHGGEAVVVIAAEDFRRLKEEMTSNAPAGANRVSPHRDY